MNFSEDLIEQIKRHEGLELMIYNDSRGFPTIGYGHKLSGDEKNLFKDGINTAKAEQLLMSDLTRIEEELLRKEAWIADVEPVRRDVLYNMAYNLGAAGLLEFHHALNMVQKRQWQQAAAEMRNSRWCNQVGNRCDELSRQMETGRYQ
ncbi:MAG: glycoside hydrolase family protein [Nitrospirae bacterium]|nr:glycoside hydrolase family protein [Nitrospirota bacterium]